MHRTQILLEQEQYEVLREEALRSDKSLGGFIRELLDSALSERRKALAKRGKSPGLRKLGGFFRSSDTAARDHDKHLYGGVG